MYQENRSLATLRSDLQSKLADRDANIDKLKNEKAKSAEELAVLKASDIAKEVEFSRLKLKNLETDLEAAGVRVTALEPVMIKIKLYADAVAAIDQNLAPPWTTPLYSNLKNIDIAISALGDNQVAEQWGLAKSAFDAGGDGGRDLIQTLLLIISKISDII